MEIWTLVQNNKQFINIYLCYGLSLQCYFLIQKFSLWCWDEGCTEIKFFTFCCYQFVLHRNMNNGKILIQLVQSCLNLRLSDPNWYNLVQKRFWLTCCIKRLTQSSWYGFKYYLRRKIHTFHLNCTCSYFNFSGKVASCKLKFVVKCWLCANLKSCPI